MSDPMIQRSASPIAEDAHFISPYCETVYSE